MAMTTSSLHRAPRLPAPAADGETATAIVVVDLPAQAPRWARLTKRAFDLMLASALGIVTAPILVIAVIAIRLDSSGPAIFRQVRVGAGMRRFTMLKLRTMLDDNDDSIHVAYVEALIAGEAQPIDGAFKLKGDPRITRVGRILRRWSIDELPQLWNVMSGEMSLVGPRPPLPREAALYDERTLRRLQMKPGLTGLWQVSGRCELSFEAMVDLDLEYQEAWSPWLDVKIVLRTPGAIASRRGAR
jgi:lipopolysaccharide/colanic/teichoic acid biosynthesis glycosyltransferase